MPRTKTKRPTRAQHRAPRAAVGAAPELSPALLTGAYGAAYYARAWAPEGHVEVIIPGVDGTDVAEAIPERRVPFLGVAPCVEVSLKQANRYQEVGRPLVTALCGWSVAMDGVVVYGGFVAGHEAHRALMEAGAAIPRLLALPFRPWVEADWLGRPVYLEGRPATVTHLLGSSGRVRLVPAEAGAFGPGVAEFELDLLSDRIWWWPAANQEASPDA